MTFQNRSKLLVALLLGEAAVLSAHFDASIVVRSIGNANLVFAGDILWFVHFLISFATIFGTFSYLRFNAPLKLILLERAGSHFPLRYLAGHCVAVIAFALCCEGLSDSSTSVSLFLPWILSGLAALVLAAFALLSLPVWITVFKATGLLGIYAALGASACASAVAQSWKLWGPFSRSTFYLVDRILKPVLPHMTIDPSRLLIGSDHFQIVVASSCSGLEGVALLLVFLVLWLILFRHEIRFPQAFLLIPIGMATLYFLNALRIAALIWIGHSGFPDVALQGFHSQAGWILFNFVALVISVGARRVPWLQRQPLLELGAKREKITLNADALYLLPFLAILIGGMLARVASGEFEWLYGVRLISAAIPLWCFRRKYMSLAMEPDWGTAIYWGAAVFVFWIALDALLKRSSLMTSIPGPLLGSPWPVRSSWIAVRVFTAITAVPIAEELAFRGYLMRRLVSEDFREVQPQRVGPPAVLVSSLLFGLLHGSRWLAGAGAGYCFSRIYAKRGNLSSAVLAHAIANLFLSVYVLVTGRWNFW